MRKLAFLTLAAVIAAPVGLVAAPQQGDKDATYEELNLFDEAFERVRDDAVDPVTDPKLIGAAINGMLSGLDPRAVYLDPTAYQAMRTQASSDQAGIGVVLALVKGELKVISPRDGSPAAAAGIEPGDVVFSIGKELTYELSLAEAQSKLTGPPGSKVALVLQRGEGPPIKLTVTRAADKLQTVTARVADGDIGYLRVAGFDDGTAAALTAAVQDLRQKTGGKLLGLVIDLRNNPGGNFQDAVATAAAFLDKGEIALVKGRKSDSVKHITGPAGDLVKGLPIVALVNGGTAREAELVAGALQDNHRAMLLGTKTYGESGVETLIPLGSGGAIRLTTAHFTTPDGHEIDGKGLEPDLVVTPLKVEKIAQEEGLHEADLPGALKNPDQPVPTASPAVGSPAPADKSPPPAKPSSGAAPASTTSSQKVAPSVATKEIGGASDEQLTQALDILRGLVVYNRRASG